VVQVQHPLALARLARARQRAAFAGLVGSFVGGLLGSLLSDDGLALRPSGIIGSIVGAVLVLLVWGAVRGRS